MTLVDSFAIFPEVCESERFQVASVIYSVFTHESENICIIVSAVLSKGKRR